MGYKPWGEWVDLDDRHRAKFLKGEGRVVGLVLVHVSRTEPSTYCSPGLVQWEQYGTRRPLFTVVSEPTAALSLSPHIVCADCGDKGFVTDGKWVDIVALSADGGEGAEPLDVFDVTGDDMILEEDIERKDRGLDAPENVVKKGRSVLFTREMAEEAGLLGFGDDLDDSGERISFASGAVRERAAGKGRYDALQVFALKRIALVMEKADRKYGDCRNWEKGMPASQYVDSAMRHLCQYVEGDRGEDHLAQAAWNLMSLMHTEEMVERGVLPDSLMDMPDYGGTHEDYEGEEG